MRTCVCARGLPYALLARAPLADDARAALARRSHAGRAPIERRSRGGRAARGCAPLARGSRAPLGRFSDAARAAPLGRCERGAARTPRAALPLERPSLGRCCRARRFGRRYGRRSRAARATGPTERRQAPGRRACADLGPAGARSDVGLSAAVRGRFLSGAGRVGPTMLWAACHALVAMLWEAHARTPAPGERSQRRPPPPRGVAPIVLRGRTWACSACSSVGACGGGAPKAVENPRRVVWTR